MGFLTGRQLSSPFSKAARHERLGVSRLAQGAELGR
jgi:hypothetical protein